MTAVLLVGLLEIVNGCSKTGSDNDSHCSERSSATITANLSTALKISSSALNCIRKLIYCRTLLVLFRLNYHITCNFLGNVSNLSLVKHFNEHLH